MRPIFVTALLASLLAGSVVLTPTKAEAFYCPAVKTVDLTPVSPPIRPRVFGRAEISECFDLSFLHIVVRANVADGTQLMAVIRATSPYGQPLLSDWITMTTNRGTILWQGATSPGIPNGGLTGRTLEIVDSNFTTLAQATF